MWPGGGVLLRRCVQQMVTTSRCHVQWQRLTPRTHRRSVDCRALGGARLRPHGLKCCRRERCEGDDVAEHEHWLGGDREADNVEHDGGRQPHTPPSAAAYVCATGRPRASPSPRPATVHLWCRSSRSRTHTGPRARPSSRGRRLRPMAAYIVSTAASPMATSRPSWVSTPATKTGRALRRLDQSRQAEDGRDQQVGADEEGERVDVELCRMGSDGGELGVRRGGQARRGDGGDQSERGGEDERGSKGPPGSGVCHDGISSRVGRVQVRNVGGRPVVSQRP